MCVSSVRALCFGALTRLCITFEVVVIWHHLMPRPPEPPQHDDRSRSPLRRLAQQRNLHTASVKGKGKGDDVGKDWQGWQEGGDWDGGQYWQDGWGAEWARGFGPEDAYAYGKAGKGSKGKGHVIGQVNWDGHVSWDSLDFTWEYNDGTSDKGYDTGTGKCTNVFHGKGAKGYDTGNPSGNVSTTVNWDAHGKGRFHDGAV